MVSFLFFWCYFLRNGGQGQNLLMIMLVIMNLAHMQVLYLSSLTLREVIERVKSAAPDL